MILINYKRLAEVKIFHEFYLFKADGTSYFELTTDKEKKKLLMDRVVGGLYNLQRDLEIVPTEETKRLLKAYKMKFVPTSTGLIVGLEVEELPTTGNDDDIEYQPRIPIKDGLTLSFQIKLARTTFRNFTNIPLRPSLPAIYFLSNKEESNKEGSSKKAPVLSLPILTRIDSTAYTMGSLATSNNDLFEALDSEAKGNDASKWAVVENLPYLNENDRRLLPHRFTYRFAKKSQIKEAEFTLRNKQGNRVKKIKIKSDKPLLSTAVDFTTESGGTFDNPALPIPAGMYTLRIKRNGVKEEHNIILDTARYDRQSFGLIELQISKGNNALHLLQPNGKLKTTSEKGHPIFQVLCKSRRTFWRYISNKKKELVAEPRADPFLAKEAANLNNLVTKSAHYFSIVPTVFQTDDPATTGVNETVFLPNPAPEVLRLEKERYYSNIQVGPLKDLIKDS